MSSTSSQFTAQELEQRKALMEQMQFLGQMASTETALFHQTAAAKNGFGITDMKTISTLMQEGSMTAGQIAKRLSLTTGAVTSVIDRLEKAKMVKRYPDVHDRRKVVVRVNKEKIERLGKVYDSIGEVFAKVLERYSTKELEFLVEYYKLSIELTKSEIAKLNKS
jgi:DNA-binding MarR family transcriptional regulator